MIVNVKIGDLYRSRSLAPDGHHTPCLNILISVNTWILTLCNVHFQYIIVFCPCLLTHEWALGHRALACVSPRLYFTPGSPPAVWWPSLWQSATKYLQSHIPHILVSTLSMVRKLELAIPRQAACSCQQFDDLWNRFHTLMLGAAGTRVSQQL